MRGCRARGSPISSAAIGCSPIVDFVATGLPFLPVVPLLMMSPTWGLRGSFVWEFSGKLDGLIYVIEVYSHFAAFLLTGIVAFAAGWGMRHRALKFHPFGWVLLAIGGAHLSRDAARPVRDLHGRSADADLARFHADRLRTPQPATSITCAAALRPCWSLLLAIRVFEVQIVWSDLSHMTTSFRESVRHIERGSKVLVAYADPDAGDDVKRPRARACGLPRRSSSVGAGDDGFHRGRQADPACARRLSRPRRQRGRHAATIAQLLQVADRRTRRRALLDAWTSDYDYVYVLFTDPSHENPDPARLTAIYAGERFVLYRINSADMADAGEAAIARTESEAAPCRSALPLRK